MREGFVFLDEAVSGLLWDARYAGKDNFTGAPVDGYRVNRVVGTTEMARALGVAQESAAAQGLTLMVWDAYRPQRAVDAFVRWTRAPEDFKTKDRFYPRIGRTDMIPQGYIAPRSGHSRGSAIDLTLSGLDMGGGFDFMDVSSHHGGAQGAAAENRARLRDIMERAGFTAYEMEWWHYKLAIEPYPDTYFDFPIDIGGVHG